MGDVVDRNLRAGDADRDRVAELLRRHFTAGRLTPEEFDERLGAAMRARTYGELADLHADLPDEPVGYELPVPVAGSSTRRPPIRRGPGNLSWRTQAERGAFASYVTSVAICVLIWAVTGHGYFWPIWVIGAWGIVLLGSVLAGGRGHRR